jgi:hypothetical protein
MPAVTIDPAILPIPVDNLAAGMTVALEVTGVAASGCHRRHGHEGHKGQDEDSGSSTAHGGDLEVNGRCQGGKWGPAWRDTGGKGNSTAGRSEGARQLEEMG